MNPEPTTVELPVSATARETLMKLHPAVQDDWRLKFLKVEQEAVDAYEERLQRAENGG
jgi:hypothetical protein